MKKITILKKLDYYLFRIESLIHRLRYWINRTIDK